MYIISSSFKISLYCVPDLLLAELCPNVIRCGGCYYIKERIGIKHKEYGTIELTETNLSFISLYLPYSTTIRFCSYGYYRVMLPDKCSKICLVCGKQNKFVVNKSV